MLKERRPELPGQDFQPSWGPMMGVVWSLVLYVSAIIVALAMGDRGLIKTELPDGSLDVSAMEWVMVPFQIVGVVIVASRLRFNPLAVLALRPPARLGKLILIVLALMAATVALLVAVLVVQEFWFSENDVPINQNQASFERFVRRDGLIFSLIMKGFLSPLQEEMVFRGLLLLSFFRTRLWFWGAAFLTSLLFALLHNPLSINLFLHAPHIIMGLAFAWALRTTGSLWVPIFLHSLNNSIAIIALSAF